MRRKKKSNLPYGPSLGKKGIFSSCSRLKTIIGKTKTKVFPLPVKAMPIISLPLSLKISLTKFYQLVYYRVSI